MGATPARAIFLSGAAIGIGLAARGESGKSLDERLFAMVNRRLASRPLDAFFAGVTELGSLWASLAASAVFAGAGRRRAATRALGAAAATWVVGQALKRVFDTPRPYDRAEGSRLLIDRPQGRSWPSSHPAVLMAFSTVAARELGLRSTTRRALGALASVVGLSRIYLGVHYPSDVAGGLLIGRAVAGVWPPAS
jgi:undecaprenyl-diphosphatase